MKNGIPQWADAQISANLPNVRATGENATVEFKERFPEQAHQLARELAALATSGGGVLYIGINDNGDLVGIDAPDGDSRDTIVERAQGIVFTVKPSLRADILFAVENTKAVLAIRILPQDEPVFYYENRPYIRDGRRSRPATPDEVKERVWVHPSSESKRRMEDLRIKQAEQFVEQNARRTQMADEVSNRHRMNL